MPCFGKPKEGKKIWDCIAGPNLYAGSDPALRSEAEHWVQVWTGPACQPNLMHEAKTAGWGFPWGLVN